jgi:hypothetical protein
MSSYCESMFWMRYEFSALCIGKKLCDCLVKSMLRADYVVEILPSETRRLCCVILWTRWAVQRRERPVAKITNVKICAKYRSS